MTNGKKQSTRNIILQAIQQSPQSTVDMLAKVANISPVTVRHHLNTLQADGLIEANTVRRKVGRPYYVYTLSEEGQERFPKRYVRLTSRLLNELKNRFPEDIVQDIFSNVVQGMIESDGTPYQSLPIEERLDYLVKLLDQEGFAAGWEKTSEGYKVVEHSCPYISIGHEHTEVCSFDKELMLNVLQTPIHQHSCMLEGANCCEFSIAVE